MTHLFTHAQSFLAKATPNKNIMQHLKLLLVAMLAAVMVAKGQTVSTFATAPNGTSYDFIAFDASGNLFASSGGDNSIKKVDKNGNTSTFVSFPLTQSVNGLAFDASGNLYVGGFDNSVAPGVNTILKVTTSATISTVTSMPNSSFGSQDYSLNNPNSLAFDSNGDLYVSNFNGTVGKIMLQGNSQIYKIPASRFFPSGSGTSSFGELRGLAFDSQGNLYVANANSIIKVDKFGLNPTVFATFNYEQPSGIAFDKSGNLFVAVSTAIKKITPSGIISTIVDVSGGNISSLAFDNVGNLYANNFSYGTTTQSTILKITINQSPTITSFSPTSAAVGSTITITGANFTGATGVTIGGVAATSFTVVNATTITAVVGSGATSGSVVVTTGGGSATRVCEKTSTAFQIYPKCGYLKWSTVFAIVRYAIYSRQ